MCVFIIYGMRFWHSFKEVSSLWFCHVLFFFSTLVYKKMLCFLNLALLWKIDSPEGACGERGKSRKTSLGWCIHCVWLQPAYLPSLCWNAAFSNSCLFLTAKRNLLALTLSCLPAWQVDADLATQWSLLRYKLPLVKELRRWRGGDEAGGNSGMAPSLYKMLLGILLLKGVCLCVPSPLQLEVGL